MGANTVDVYFKGHNRDLTKTIADLKRDLAALRDSKVKLAVDVDSAQVARLKADLAGIRNQTLRIRTQTVGDAMPKARDARIGVQIRGGAAASAELDRIARPRVAPIRIDADSSHLQQIRRETEKADSALRRMGVRGAQGLTLIGNTASGAVKPLALVAAGSVALSGAAAAAPFALAAGLTAATAAAGGLAAIGTGALGGFIAKYAVLGSDATYDNMIRNTDKVKQRFTDLAVKGASPAMNRLFDELPRSFDRMAPSIERISVGTGKLTDRLTNQLPNIADKLGPTLESAFNAGVPGIEKLIDKAPDLTKSFGKFFDSLGSKPVQDVFGGMVDALPGAIESAGRGVEKMASAGIKLKDWLKSDDLAPMREGWQEFVSQFDDVDTSGLKGKLTDLMNTGGQLAGSIDVQALVDSMTLAAGAVDKVATAVDTLGWKGTLAIGIGARIGGAILAGIGEALARKLTTKIADKLIDGGGAATDVAINVGEELGNALVDSIGGALSGLGSGLGYGLGRWISSKLLPDAKTDLEIENVHYPELDPITADIEVGTIIVPELDPITVPIVFGDAETGTTGAGQPITVPVKIDGSTVASQIAALGGYTVPAEVRVTAATLEQQLAAISSGLSVYADLQLRTDSINAQLGGISAGLAPFEVPVQVNVTDSKGRSGWDFASEFLGKANSQLQAVIDWVIPGPPDVPEPAPVPVDVTASGTVVIPPQPPVALNAQINTEGVNTDLSGLGATAGQSFAAGLSGQAGAASEAAAGLGSAAAGVTIDLNPLGTAAGQSFVAGLTAQVDAVKTAAAQLGAATSVSVDLSGAGRAAGSSFAAGLRASQGEVASAAAQLGRVAADNKGHYRGLRGIAADRIMLVDHGKAMVGGFIRGMRSQTGDLVEQSRQLADSVWAEFDSDLRPAFSLKGGIDISQTVYATVEAGTLGDPVKIGRQVQDFLDAYVAAVGHSGRAESV
ncbi:hypothetical protein [Prescottella equi]